MSRYYPANALGPSDGPPTGRSNDEQPVHRYGSQPYGVAPSPMQYYNWRNHHGPIPYSSPSVSSSSQAWGLSQAWGSSQAPPAVPLRNCSVPSPLMHHTINQKRKPIRTQHNRSVVAHANKQFFRDASIGIKSNRGDAKLELERVHGGPHNGIPQVVHPCGSRAGKKGKPKHYRYHCLAPGCQWRAQIEEDTSGETPTYTVLIKSGSPHNHGFDKEDPVDPESNWGLTTRQIQVADQYLEVEKKQRGRNIADVEADELYKILLKDAQKVGDYCYTDNEVLSQQLLSQVQGYVHRGRKRHTRTLLGVDGIKNQDDLDRCLANWKLDVPSDYKPRDDFKSAREIAVALGLKIHEADKLFLFDLTCGPLHERYKECLVPKNDHRKFERDIEQAFFAFSPTGLWQLMNLIKRHKGTRQVCSDGTGGICQDLSTLIVIGALSVKYRCPRKGVTSSLRPIVYLKVGNERLHPYHMTLCALRMLGVQLFGAELELDWGTSDSAQSFIASHLLFNAHPETCDIHTKSEPSYKKKTNELELGTDDDESTDFQDLYGCSPPAKGDKLPLSQHQVLTQAPNDVDNDADSDLGELDQTIPLYTVAMDKDGKKEYTFYQAKGATICWFHVTQHFTKKNGFVGLIKNKKMYGQKKSEIKVWKNQTFYEHVCLIHHCCTPAQRAKVTQLVLSHWREVGETASADLFYKSYCRPPMCNFNYNCTEEAGVPASNCSSESFNYHNIKGGSKEIKYNVSLETLIVDTLPKLVARDALYRHDPCTIEIPTACHPVCVAVCMFMVEGRDVIEIGENEWLCNLRYNIGVQLCPNRRRLYAMSKEAVDRVFKKDGMDGPGVARNMVEHTRQLCLVQKRMRGGHTEIIGSCENCQKQLGYTCPAAVYIRNKHNLLEKPLEKLWCSMGNTRGKGLVLPSQGSRGNCYKGGPSATGKIRRSTPVMQTDQASYLSTLSKERLSATAKYLCLTSKVQLMNCYKSQSKLLSLVKSFWEDTSGYRSEQKATEDAKKLERTGCHHDLFENDADLLRHGESSYDP